MNGVSFDPMALAIAEEMPREKWLELGKHLRSLERGYQWWIGDWANYGERKYGELKAAAKEAKFDYGMVREYARVARRFELSVRTDNLTFAHHEVVAALPDEAAFRLLKDAQHNELSVDDLRQLVARERNVEGELPGSDTCTVADLDILIRRGSKFGTVYADPPWLYGNQATRAATGDHYEGMTAARIIEEFGGRVQALVLDDAHLHLWTTNAFLFECPEIMKAWGFEYKSCFVWVKPQMGIGNYWRVSHEFLLFGVRGSADFRNHAARSWMELKRGKHSVKPEAVRRLIESASPPPYLELFGRRTATNWTVFGNEIKRSALLDGDALEVRA